MLGRTGANGSSIPFDEPSGIAYFDDRLIVANQSYLAGDSAHQALLALGTGEEGARVYVPADAGPISFVCPPAKRHVRHKHHTRPARHTPPTRPTRPTRHVWHKRHARR